MPKVKSKKRFVRDLDNIKSMLVRLEKKIGQNYSSESSSSSSDSEFSESNTSGHSSPIVRPVATGGEVTTPIATNSGKELFELLGENPSIKKNTGSDIHEELAVRWSNYLKDGITIEARKELLQKYLIPSNCKTLNAPLVNEEVKAIVPSQIQRNDHFLSNLQDQLGASLSAWGAIISQKLTEPENQIVLSNEIVEKMIDVSQLVANVHHAISLKRRFEINPFMNDESRTASTSNAIDEFLYGTNFLSKVKERQDVKKAGAEIKKTTRTTPIGESSTKNYLNSRRSFKRPREPNRRHNGYRKPYFN